MSRERQHAPVRAMRSLLASVALVLVGTLLAGLVRGYVLFVPGILGMACGAALGYATGRLARSHAAGARESGQRFGLAAGAVVVYAVGTAAVVSVVNVGAMGLPLDWLVDTVKGYEGELFAGYSRNSYQAVGGTLKGAWWVIFGLLDAGLFGFVFLVMNGIGLGEPAAQAQADALTPTHAPGGLAYLFTFLAVAGAGVTLLSEWPRIVSSWAGAAPEATIAALQGDWVFGEDAAVLGRDNAARRFRVSRGLGVELAGLSEQPAQFMFSMEPRRDGVFEGRLYVRGTDILSIRMRPSDDRNEMQFVVDWPSPTGAQQGSLTARRRSPRE